MSEQLCQLVGSLVSLLNETEWVEFKHNDDREEPMGEYLSALSNSAALHGKDEAYLVWGVEDGTHNIVGTSFKPREKKIGNEELENWLLRLLTPRIDFRMHEFEYQGRPMVIFCIPPARQQPVRFRDAEWIRVGSYKKKLSEHPEKERELWKQFEAFTWEPGIAAENLSGERVLALLDFTEYFDLLKMPLPSDQQGILNRLNEESLVSRNPSGQFDITNMGAVLLAKDLRDFDGLSRKQVRVIKYLGSGRTQMEREWQDPASRQGYAVGFGDTVNYINSLLPQNAPIGEALRAEVQMYPPIAIRELMANALIHQDFSVAGAGPMVEIFSDRLEITNPGNPLVDTNRFIDAPPKSRNERLAALMRRMAICEEAGTGIDKVIESIEVFQLPPPDFTTPVDSTKATLFAPRSLAQMDREERIRACYQHASLCVMFGKKMTNSTLRKRFGIERKNYAAASRIIRDSIDEGLVKPVDPNAGRRYMRYVPNWA